MTATPSAPTQAAQRTIRGVDVASYQGPPGQWAPAAGRIKWAAVKVTELEPNGIEYVNPDASADWDYLAQKNLGRVGYLFGHPSTSATATVEFFAHQIRSMGLRNSDGVALDLEVTDGLGPTDVDKWAAHVMSELHDRLHRMPVLYTFLSFAEAGNTASLGKYPLWIADPSSPPGHPRIPLPWKTWTMHQYDISGSIDRDVANFATKAGMERALGKVKGAVVTDLGGSQTGDLMSIRWPNGTTIVAGLGTNGFVQTTRWHPSDRTWGPWRDVSPEKALGTAGMIAWGETMGHLYYVNSTGAVIQLTTNNGGATWT